MVIYLENWFWNTNYLNNLYSTFELQYSLDSCSVLQQFNNQSANNIGYCTDKLNSNNEDTGTYGYRWRKINLFFRESDQRGPSYEAFQYKNSTVLSGIKFFATFDNYNAGGFAFNMKGSLGDIQSNLLLLRDQNWIDRNRRALFYEFSVYNPNVNLFAYCNILFEVLSSGNYIISTRFEPFTLYSLNSSYLLFINICSYFN